MNLEEELENLSVADSGRIEDDLDRFGMCSMVPIGRMGCVAACVANARRENAFVAAKEVLNARSSVIACILHLAQVRTVAFGFHVVTMNESQRGRLDTVAQTAAIHWAVREYVPKMAVAMRRAHFRVAS